MKKIRHHKVPGAAPEAVPVAAPAATGADGKHKPGLARAREHPREAEQRRERGQKGRKGKRSGGGVGAGRGRVGRKTMLSSVVRVDPGFPPAEAGGKARAVISKVGLACFQAPNHRLARCRATGEDIIETQKPVHS